MPTSDRPPMHTSEVCRPGNRNAMPFWRVVSVLENLDVSHPVAVLHLCLELGACGVTVGQ